MSMDKAVWMRKTAVANASQPDKYLSHLCVNSLTKHVFTVNAKFAGDKASLHGTVLYTLHHLHPLVATFFKNTFD